MKYKLNIILSTVIAGSLLAGPALGFENNFRIERFPNGFLNVAETRINDAVNRLNAQSEKLEQVFSELEERFKTDEIIVQFEGETNFRRVKLSISEDFDETLRRYRSRGNVIYAEPNFIAQKQEAPNDPFYSYQWNLHNGEGGINAEDAWQFSRGAGVTVAVIDTGVAYEKWQNFYQAPDLAGTSFVQGYDFVNGDTHANDDDGHGTHVTGTIAQSTNNGQGVAGVASEVSIMPIKVLDWRGSGTYADIAEGIRFAADNGADVINLSLGGSSNASYLRDAVKYAYEKGVVIVAAAGNSGSGSVLYPAAYDDYVIAVGATRYDENRAYYSNFGSSLDLMAPGGYLSADQNNDGYADGILQETFTRRYSNNFGLYFYQGTSMASPHVAGVAALVLGTGNASGPDGVREALEQTAKDLGAPGRDNSYGWGLVNAFDAVRFNNQNPAPTPTPTPEPPPAGGSDPEPNDNPPTVNLTNPTEGEVISGAIVISADASDDNEVDRVEFYLNNTFLASDNNSPYNTLWNSESVADNTYVIKAVAIDSLNQSSENSVSIMVKNQVESEPDPTPEPPTSNAFYDGFEGGGWNGMWTSDNQNRWTISSREASEGNKSARVEGEAENATLTSKAIDLGGNTNAKVKFSWFLNRRVDRGEYLAFDVSLNNGATWVQKAILEGNETNENAWQSTEIELSGISNLKLRFRGKMSRNREDAFVDDISVVAL